MLNLGQSSVVIASSALNRVFLMSRSLRVQVLLLAAMLLILVGCMVPTKFDARFDVTGKNQSTLHVKGQFLDYVGLSGIREKDLARISEADYKKHAVKMLSQMGEAGKGLQHIGQLNYKGFIAEAISFPPSAARFQHNLFKWSVDKQGVNSIVFPNVDGKHIQTLEVLNLKLDGTLRVSLPKNVEVLEDNADKKPWLFSRDYVWTYKHGERKSPMIRFRFTS